MEQGAIFVINCGSSSLKFQVIDPESEEMLVGGVVEKLGTEEAFLRSGDQLSSLPDASHRGAIEAILPIVTPYMPLCRAIGHRVVHGGESLVDPVRVDSGVIDRVESYASLAPLHNSHHALGMRLMEEYFPDLPQVALFDTAFHSRLPDYAYLYAIPYEYYREHQIRRYGFHGLSHQYVSEQGADMVGIPLEDLHIISCHLGNGCSVTAIKGGVSIDTSMGMGPLEGLMMGHRSGDIDPTLFSYLSESCGLSLEEISDLLNHRSGILGVSGVSHDVRLVMEAAEAGHRQARLAIEIFCYRLAKYIAAYLVPLGKIDLLIFTGGIGENAAEIRSMTMRWLEGLKLRCDELRNGEMVRGRGGIISPQGEYPLTAVIPTNEELLIAKEAARLIAASP
ncbi:MAG: acetate kinase [Chlamydiota bacterium]|nr:acetate kinase [Chlamydiota bacterium]